MKILFIASEAEPFIKVGGLADVAGSLPKAISNLTISRERIDIRLCLPYYPKIKEKFPNLPIIASLEVLQDKSALPVSIYYHDATGIPVYFVEGNPISRDPEVYNLDTSVVGDKFIFFNKAIISFLEKNIFMPDILHLNDWHTALLPYLLANDHALRNKFRTLLTLHNLPFMGAGIEKSMDKYGIPPSSNKILPDWARDLPLPMGLSTVDKIIPVSPNYAREIVETDAGCGLNAFLLSRQNDIKGILNGFDTSIWDPQKDLCIPNNYNIKSLEKRELNKKDILREFNLSGIKKPLLAIISRMDQQKGIDVAIDSLRLIGDRSWNLIILGSGNPTLEQMCKEFNSEYPNRVRTINSFNSALSHRLYASADILLMPSRYEPCGLSQLIAMRYGCIPVATDVGGLHDTIVDIRENNNGTGFLCDTALPELFSRTLNDAIVSFSNQVLWHNLINNAMDQDFSWNNSAKEYYDIYEQLTERGSNENH